MKTTIWNNDYQRLFNAFANPYETNEQIWEHTMQYAQTELQNTIWSMNIDTVNPLIATKENPDKYPDLSIPDYVELNTNNIGAALLTMINLFENSGYTEIYTEHNRLYFYYDSGMNITKTANYEIRMLRNINSLASIMDKSQKNIMMSSEAIGKYFMTNIL